MEHPETRSFDHARQIAERFEAVLNSYGVAITTGSELEAAMFEMLDLEDRRQGRSPNVPGEDVRAAMSRTLGVLHCAELLVATQSRGRQLHSIVPHLQLLDRGEVAQNVRRIGDDAANKLFELLNGLACMNFATQIALDDPEQSKGDNPDILFTHGSRQWALACKVPNGESMISAFDNIKAAAAQVERSPAERGIIVLNARNWINHDALWRPPGGKVIGKPQERDIHWAWLTPEMPFAMLRTEADWRYSQLLEVKHDEVMELFSTSKRLVPIVLVFLQSATLVASTLGPIMTRAGMFAMWQFGQRVHDDDLKVLNSLNESMFQLPVIPDLT